MVTTVAEAKGKRKKVQDQPQADELSETGSAEPAKAPAPAAPPAAVVPAAAPAPAAAVKPAVKKNSVAVMDTVPVGVPDALAMLTTQTISSYAQNSLAMDVISKDDVKKLVSFEQMRQLAGCDTGTCAQVTDLGSALGVETILTSTIGKIGDKYQITVVAMDVASAKAIGRGTRELRSEDEIVENARDLTHFALKHEQRESKGYVRINVPMTAARIDIDGQAFGVSPLATPARLLAGRHAIHVEKEGFLPFDGSIDVEAGKEATLEVKLIAKKDIKVAGAGFLPWAGATGGIAIVGAIGSYIAYRHAQIICQDYTLDSTHCTVAGKNPVPIDRNYLNQKNAEVDLWGNKIAFYGAIGSGVLGAASVALFSAYFIAGTGAGGDEPPANTPFKVVPTADGFAVHF